MSEMIERAARAAFEQGQREGVWAGHAWDDADLANVRDTYRRRVRAMLIAIREPTDEVVAAGEAWQMHCSDADTLFSEMINAALGDS